MQSLHRGSFCAQDGEKPVESPDAKHDGRAEAIRRDVRRETR